MKSLLLSLADLSNKTCSFYFCWINTTTVCNSINPIIL